MTVPRPASGTSLTRASHGRSPLAQGSLLVPAGGVAVVELEHGEKITVSEDLTAKEWIVTGPDGAVNFLVFPEEKSDTQETLCTLGIHARVMTGQKVPCDVLPEGRCCEQVIGQGAHQLWVLSSHGNEPKMIWEVLEGWYNTTLGRREADG
jgi:hypothetical protein